jgi:hypothetical protein
MLVFLDFEASSLAKRSYPIEVAWVFADGRSESHLILPAPDWTDWDAEAEAIHGIDRSTLLLDGTPHRVVANRMMEVVAGHDLLVSAPSWDGKWLSALLRAAGLPRHSLRLRRNGAERSLIAQRLLEALICLCHLCQFPELTANVPLEPRIVIDARRLIVFLAYQFLEARANAACSFVQSAAFSARQTHSSAAALSYSSCASYPRLSAAADPASKPSNRRSSHFRTCSPSHAFAGLLHHSLQT